MKKTVNLTVRVEQKLKLDAEEACLYLDKTLSSVIRDALRRKIYEYQVERNRDTRRASAFMEGEHAQVAYDALKREMDRKGGQVAIKFDSTSTRLVPDRGPSVIPAPRKTDPSEGEAGALALMTRKQRREYERQRSKGKV